MGTVPVIYDHDLSQDARNSLRSYTLFDRETVLFQHLKDYGLKMRVSDQFKVSKVVEDLHLPGEHAVFSHLKRCFVFNSLESVEDAISKLPAPKPKKTPPRKLKERFRTLFRSVRSAIRDESWARNIKNKFDPDSIEVNWYGADAHEVFESVSMDLSNLMGFSPVRFDGLKDEYEIELCRIRNDMSFEKNIVQEILDEELIERIHNS